MPSTITIVDYSQETSSFGVNSAVLTAGNIVAQTSAAIALSDAVQNLSLGHLSKQTLVNLPVNDPGVPTNVFAQRELKWLVTYQAVTSGKKFQIEIAAPDLTDNVVANSDIADLGSDDWADFVTAFVAFAKSPDDVTDSVIVLGARLVGRNI